MTDEEINALTDQQINVMMQSSVTGAKKYMRSTSTKTLFYEDGDGGVVAVNVQDFCNNPSVMMPIVFENGIGLFPNRMGLGESDLWTATYSIYKRYYCTHSNPLRAAAIAYLKMKGVL